MDWSIVTDWLASHGVRIFIIILVSIILYLLLRRLVPIVLKHTIKQKERGKRAEEELEQRISQGIGVVPKGSPRVMHGYFSSLSDPTVVHMLEEAGIAVPVSELQLFDGGGFTPSVFPEGIQDRRELQASAYLQGAVGNCLPTQIRSVIEACNRLNLDGLFWFIHHSCRPLLGETLIVKEAVTKELGLPFMVLEGDGYDPEFYSIERVRNNIETFAEILQTSKAARGGV